jgi:F-type H+-transporting ATPase subunit a
MLISLSVAVLLAAVMVTLGYTVAHRRGSVLAIVAEYAFESLDKLATDIVGRSVPWVATFSGSLFLFIATANVAGQLPGVHSPMAKLANTSALAVLVFLTVPLAGIRAHGPWGYVKHYFRPNPLFMPLHLVSEMSRTLALSVRLFGNMASGQLIVGLLVSLVGLLVPVPMMALDLLIGLLQAYIFTILSTVYIGAALRAGEES